MRNKVLLTLICMMTISISAHPKQRIKEIKRDTTNQKMMEIREFAEMRRQHEKRRSRELELEQEQRRTNTLTKCMDLTKVVAVIATALIGLIINGVR